MEYLWTSLKSIAWFLLHLWGLCAVLWKMMHTIGSPILAAPATARKSINPTVSSLLSHAPLQHASFKNPQHHQHQHQQQQQQQRMSRRWGVTTNTPSRVLTSMPGTDGSRILNERQRHVLRKLRAIGRSLHEVSTFKEKSRKQTGKRWQILPQSSAEAITSASTPLSGPPLATRLAIAPVVLATDKYRRAGEHAVNAFWASASTMPLYNTEVVGIENLPGPKEPCVYVANHQSYLDIYTLLTWLPRPFKFVSKTSNFLIPIVGWSMYLTGHVGLDRMDRRSQIRLINDCRRLLENEAQVLLFPEGTRTTTWTEGPAGFHPVMGEFKKGAFSIAKKAGVPIVPISLVGTGNLMPNGKEGLLFPGSTKMVIHPRIETKDRDPSDVQKEARAAIASALPPGSY